MNRTLAHPALVLAALTSAQTFGAETNFWPFDVDANDVIGGAIGTVVGPVPVPTPWGFGYLFDGDDYISTDFAPGFATASSCSFAVRFKIPSDAPDTVFDVFGFERSNHQEIRLIVRGDLGGRLRASFRDDEWIHSMAFASADIRDDEWHQAICVRDADADRIYLYLDGRLICERPSPTGAVNETAARTLDIGANNNSSSGHQDFFHGTIDELRVFDHAIGYAEALDLYLDGLGHKWSFESGTNDDVGGATGTNNGVSLVATPFGTGGLFENNAFIATDLALALTATDSLSISAWFQVCGAPPAITMDICGLERTNAQEIRVMVRNELDGVPQGSYRDNFGVQSPAFGDADMRDDQWHHVVAVRDAVAGTVRLYVDGALEEENPDATGPINTTNPQTLDIGADNNSTFGHQNFFCGLVDELRIYNRALDDAEAAAFVPRDPCPGDVNCDGVVNIDDVVTVVLYFGHPVSFALGDADFDGDADVDDIVLVVLNWDETCP